MSDEPAFPGFHIDNGTTTIYGGMTLRDWFAGQFVAGRLFAARPQDLAVIAYDLADAMLEARKK